MYKMIQKNEDRLVLNYRSLKMGDVVNLCKEINKLFDEGWRIKENFTPKECPKIPMLMNLLFIKGDELDTDKVDEKEIIAKDAPKVDSEIISELDSLTKKEEIMDFATKHDIEIPDESIHHLSIKKYIREILINAEESK